MAPLRNFLIASVVPLLLGTELCAQSSPIYAWAYFDASIIPVKTDDQRHNSGRVGFAMTHAKTGWGMGFARQRIFYASSEQVIAHPTLTGWLARDGYIEDPPDDRMTVRSVLAIKEFNTGNRDIRLCVEAGVSFVHFERTVHERTESFAGLVDEHFGSTVRNCTGADVRLRAFFTVSRWMALDAAFQLDMNAIRSYGSFDFGLAFGLVRQKRRSATEHNGEAHTFHSVEQAR